MTPREDMQLSAHFTLFEFTETAQAGLQAANRTFDDATLDKLFALAGFFEAVRTLCGGHPVRMHSAYRSPALNAATKGSASTSQHVKAEAGDFDVPGQPVDETFAILRAVFRRSGVKFGQLILEEAKRDYGVARWVHASVVGTLNPAHVGQVLTKKDGPDGKAIYTLLETIT